MADSIRIPDSCNPDVSPDLNTPKMLAPERVYYTFHVPANLRQKAYEINLRLQAEQGKGPLSPGRAAGLKNPQPPKPHKHYQPRRVPMLSWKSLQSPIAGHVYIIQAGDLYKIGASTQVETRLKDHASKLANFVGTELIIPLEDAFRHERELHVRFAERWVYGEWFALTPADLDAIRAMYGRKAA